MVDNGNGQLGRCLSRTVLGLVYLDVAALKNVSTDLSRIKNPLPAQGCTVVGGQPRERDGPSACLDGGLNESRQRACHPRVVGAFRRG